MTRRSALLVVITLAYLAGTTTVPGVVAHPMAKAWTVLAPLPTGRVSLAAATGGDGQIYALGGLSWHKKSHKPVVSTILTSVEAYNPATNSWIIRAPMSTARIRFAAVTGHDGRIYVFGGFNYVGTENNPTVPIRTAEVYDPGTNAWTTLAPMRTPRYDLAATTGRDGRIYVIGGITYCEPGDLSRASLSRRPDSNAPAPVPRPPAGACHGLRTVQAFDPRTGCWANLAPLRTRRAGLVAVTGADGRIYAIGGDSVYSGAGGAGNTVEAYDPVTNTWSKRASMVVARSMGFGAALAPNGRIYVFGGCVGRPGNHGCSVSPQGSVEMYDLRTKRWRVISATIHGRSGLAGAAGKDGHIYAIGGGTLVDAYSPKK
ncbi:MAG: kelch repeat-containing protein [Chloroflexota bacterium]